MSANPDLCKAAEHGYLLLYLYLFLYSCCIFDFFNF